MPETEKRRERMPGADFIRAVCALGIIIFHFSVYTNSPLTCFHYNANSQCGSPIVTVFFVLSGMMLRYNNYEISSLKKFYYKRWKAIFPAFYIAYVFFFVQNVFENGELFYMGEPWRLIFSLLGIDGYLATTTYYIIGEWFLGAIILLYVLYPLVTVFRNRSRTAAPLTVIALYVFCILTDFSPLYKFRDLPVCLLSMYFGMVVMDYKEKLLDSRASLVVSVVAAAVLLTVKLPWPPVLKRCELPASLLGFASFIVLFNIGQALMKTRASKAISELGGISYPVFLVHHVITVKMLCYNNPASLAGGIIMLLATIILSVVFAKALSVVTASVIKSDAYRKAEQKLKLS